MTKDAARRRHVRTSDLEASAVLIQEYQPAYVLSLLRTRAYIEAERPAPSVQKVNARIDRQRVLERSDVTFEFLLYEGALRWTLGSATIMVEQLDHILKMSSRSNVAIYVVPSHVATDILIGHAFHVYDRSRVVVGTRTGSTCLDDPGLVIEYAELFDRLVASAVAGDTARAHLTGIRDDHENRI